MEHIAVTRQVTRFVTLVLTLSNLTLVCFGEKICPIFSEALVSFITFLSVEEDELHKHPQPGAFTSDLAARLVIDTYRLLKCFGSDQWVS